MRVQGCVFFVQGVGTQGDRQAAGHTDEIFGWEGHCTSFTLGETTMDILRSKLQRAGK